MAGHVDDGVDGRLIGAPASDGVEQVRNGAVARQVDPRVADRTLGGAHEPVEGTGRRARSDREDVADRVVEVQALDDAPPERLVRVGDHDVTRLLVHRFPLTA